MTAYVLYYNNLSGAPAVSIKANTYALRIATLECAVTANLSTSFFSGTITYTRYSPTTQTGGTTLIPTPYRDGAPAASATIKSGATLSGGTSATFNSDIGTAVLPFDLTIAPGHAFVATPGLPSGGGTLDSVLLLVHFEELRLAWNS